MRLLNYLSTKLHYFSHKNININKKIDKNERKSCYRTNLSIKLFERIWYIYIYIYIYRYIGTYRLIYVYICLLWCNSIFKGISFSANTQKNIMIKISLNRKWKVRLSPYTISRGIYSSSFLSYHYNWPTN